MKTIAIIPARIGSKSVLKKNIRIVAGKPLVAHSIKHALESKLIDRIIVSTDSQEVADIALKYGAEVPFLRPAHLSDDHALDIGFHKHAIDWLKENEAYSPDFIINLRPTTPIRDSQILDEAIKLFSMHPEIDSMISVRLSDKSPYKMWKKDKNGLISPLFKNFETYKEPYNLPRQLLPESFIHDGYFDLTRIETILNLNSVSGSKVMPFIVSGSHIDIDYESDMEKAEKAFKSIIKF
jgi:CMP-N,N'-diacetyllegionaminic acid synthase